MISRFFSTSKPIHLVLASFALLLLFVFNRFSQWGTGAGIKTLVVEVGLFIVLALSLFIMSFFVSKNELTHRNGYKVLFFILLMALVPDIFSNERIILSNLFVILVLRRLFSLRSNQRTQKKLLDAGFWATVATYFFFPSALFFALIFVALLLFSLTDFKNWIIPLTGMLSVIVIIMSFTIITTGSFGNVEEIIQPVDLDFSAYNSTAYIIGITVFLSFSLWATFFYIQSFKEKLKVFKSSHNLVLFTAFIAVIIVIIAPQKSGSEFLFLITPVAIVISNYIESLKEHWFAELFIWVMMLSPFLRLVL